MASVYARGEVLWMKFKNKTGAFECRSTGYRRGQEALAGELARETERQAKLLREGADPATRSHADAAHVLPMPRVAAPSRVAAIVPVAELIGPAAPLGALTVADYVEEWLTRRGDVTTQDDEEARFRLHVVPLIGHMALADVRPKHIRDLVNAIKRRASTARRCKGEPLAPRTIRSVFSIVRLVFKSAVIDEHIVASPVVVESGVLPRNVDKDPAWRPSAIFSRAELGILVGDKRIPLYRRVHYGLEGIAGTRHGEAAGMRVCDYDPRCEPLGKLTVSRSGEKDRTKTYLARYVPVHPVLATLLDEWLATGWAEKYGRAPMPHDLLLPTEDNKVRKATNTLKQFHRDLDLVGLRRRRSHDLRRTFITLIRADGGRTDVLRPLTHPGESDIINLYTSFPWEVSCAEMMKLRILLPDQTPAASGTPTLDRIAPLDNDQIVAAAEAEAPRYGASYSPGSHAEIVSESSTLQTVARVGERITKLLLYH